MKKILSLLMVCVMLFGTTSHIGIVAAGHEHEIEAQSLTSVPSGYTGIYNASQLNDIRNNLNGKYILMNNIDLSLYGYWTPIGSNFDTAFTGVFDGNQYTITGMSIFISAEENLYCGLFGYSLEAAIKNTGFVNSQITAVVGSSTLQNKYLYAGIIVGSNDNGTVTNCFSDKGNINARSEAGTCYIYAGGITGENYNGNISLCYNTGYVGSYSQYAAYSGGIAGISYNTIAKCYNFGAVSSESVQYYATSGGIIGYGEGGNIDDCFNNGNVSACSAANISKNTIESIYEPKVVSSSKSVSINEIQMKSAQESIAAAGGVIGYSNNCKVETSYSVGKVSAVAYRNYAGGAIGINYGIANSVFYLDTVALSGSAYVGNEATDNVTGLTSSQLKNIASFSRFSSSIWEIDNSSGYNYPALIELPVRNCSGEPNIYYSEDTYHCLKDESVVLSGGYFKSKASDTISLSWFCNDTTATIINAPASEHSITSTNIGFSVIVNAHKVGRYTITVTTNFGDVATCVLVVCSAAQCYCNDVSVTYCSSAAALGLSAKEIDGTAKFQYCDSYFLGYATTYNHKLATMTLGLELSSYTSAEICNSGSVELDFNPDTGYSRACKNIDALYSTIGFDVIGYYNYNKLLSSESDKVAYSLAERNIMVDGKDTVILAVVVRGGGYGGEWVSNGNVGNGERHAGFNLAASEVVNTVQERIESGVYSNKVIKLWITGYSRGAAVANFVAADMNNCAANYNIKRENIYAYVFATPLNTSSSIAESSFYNNIFNIINPVDLVACVPLKAWGYKRYGVTKYLAFLDANTSAYAELNRFYRDALSSNGVDASSISLTSTDHYVYLYDVIFLLKTFIETKEEYSTYLQPYAINTLRDFYQGKLNFAAGFKSLFLSIFGEQKIVVWNYVYEWITKDWALNTLIKDENNDAVTFIVSAIVIVMAATGEDLKSLTKKAIDIFWDDWYWVDNCPLNTKNFFIPHTPESYYTYLTYASESSVFGTGTAYGLTIACPVDVNIYDLSGKLVASIVDNEVVVGLLPCGINGDKKTFLAFDDGYRIEAIGNDFGKMNISIDKFDADFKTLRTIEFYDMSLNPRLTFSADSLPRDGEKFRLYNGSQAIECNFDSDNWQGHIHNFGEWYIETEATGTTVGEKRRVCPCGKIEIISYIADMDDSISVTGISVSKSTITIEKGSTYAIGVSIQPTNATNQNITWTSSNNSVVSVTQDGIINALAVGTATITATTEDGGYSDTCEVTVYNNVESITVASMPSKIQYNYKQAFDISGLTLTVTYSDNSTQTVADTSKMTVTGYDAKKTGTQTLTVEFEGCRTNINVTIKMAWWQWLIKILLFGWVWY